MAITRIDFAGGDKEAMTFVTVTRRIGSETITAAFIAPRGHHELSAPADDRDELFGLAAHVQHAIDGCAGTNSMVYEFFSVIEKMAQ